MKNINYIAISNKISIRFKKNDYLISINEEIKIKSTTLIKATIITYGFLTADLRIGSKRGWFKCDISMDKEDFEKKFIYQSGTLKIKIHE